MWHKIVMFLVFFFLKLRDRVSSCRKKESGEWTLVSVVVLLVQVRVPEFQVRAREREDRRKGYST